MTSEHVVFVGSNTKMMTAKALLQLVDEGALTLDDPVARWVPCVRDDITVRHVLQHRSGLGEYFEHPSMDPEQGGTTGEVVTPEELVRRGMEVRDDGPEATGTYSNTNFIVAGLVLEAVDGLPLEDILDDRVFEPLGMEDSGLQITGRPYPDGLAWGHGGTREAPTAYDPSVGWAAGSAYSTASDMDRFLEAVVNGELLSEALHEEQLEGVEADLLFSVDGMTTAYGLGVMVVDFRGTTFVGHLGFLDGYSNACLVDTTSGARASVLSNGHETDAPFTAVRALGIAR